MDLVPISFLCLTAFALNLPFGYFRAGVRKYSFWWFAAIHFPIPFVVLLRLVFGQGWKVIPFVFAAAILGQFAGSYLHPKVQQGRS